jgi:single-strand DNA-binding protein
MNNITVAGQLGKDSEVKYLPNGDAVCNFSVADSQGKDKDAIWWNCQFFGKRAESLKQYLVKGQAVTVSGTLSMNKWTDKNGVEQKTLNLRVNDVALQGSKKDSSGSSQNQPVTAAARPVPTSRPAPDFSDMDSDIPF